MAAQDLPYDVIGLIVTQLKQILQDELRAKRRFPDARLAPYAAICKSWNPAIERETFRKLKLSDKRMESAERALQKDPARRLAMKRISFEINYPSSISRRRDLGERQVVERDAAFSRRLLRLFRFLECVGNSGVHRAENLTLELDVTSYSVNPEDKDGQAIEESDSDLDSDSDSDDEEAGTRFKYDPTHLRYVGEALPTICCVQGFEFPRNGANIWSSTFTTILMAMDGLEYCNIAFDDAQTLDPGTRVRYRKALGETLCKIPPTCKGFHANFEHQSDGINAPSAYDPSSLDMLSVGMRNLSTQLVELSLDSLAISPSLFWPDDAEDAAAPYWPRLQHVYVNYAPTLASGEWLVQADEEEEAEPARKKRPLFAESLDRPVLDCERTNRLFLAIGKATRNMPALQEMELEMSKELSSEFHFRAARFTGPY
ncbi:hypothetical protein DBV05_g11632 [Lasiodiplodia theobromae]|uniref:F-box domain-containing protein n=1 Tax=Lasiodiplodia theobromae TaxID=45133 RepID=A0A5N5CWK3_9PEZI|nr:hypothetical protein DBV05_g11632 [Lasiodiplodia theobromae]